MGIEQDDPTGFDAVESADFDGADPIDVDALPAHAPWPSRLLELADWEPNGRYTDPEKYDERYGAHLDYVRDNPDLGFREVAEWGAEHRPDGPTAASRRGELYLADREAVRRVQDDVLVRAFEGVLAGGETVVSLGCGWGYNLGVLAEAYPDCAFVGGDAAENAVELGRSAFADEDRVSVERFDFRDDRWEILDRERDGDVVLFTSGALTTLDDVDADFVRPVRRHRDRIRECVHLEQVDELHPEETLLGLLRRAYTRARGYNPEIWGRLAAADHLEITSATYDAVGANPLHPRSAVHWRPVDAA